jgi:hypothetical protein
LTLLLQVALLSSLDAFSGSGRIEEFYMTAKVGRAGSINYMAGLNLTLGFKSEYGLSLDLLQSGFEAANLPEDYQSPVYISTFMDGFSEMDKTFSATLRFRKCFPTSSQNLRFSLESGISLVYYEEVLFSPNDQNIWIISSHDLSYRTSRGIGLSLLGKAEFPFFEFFGMELGIQIESNPWTQFVAGYMGFQIGRVR